MLVAADKPLYDPFAAPTSDTDEPPADIAAWAEAQAGPPPSRDTLPAASAESALIFGFLVAAGGVAAGAALYRLVVRGWSLANVSRRRAGFAIGAAIAAMTPTSTILDGLLWAEAGQVAKGITGLIVLTPVVGLAGAGIGLLLDRISPPRSPTSPKRRHALDFGANDQPIAAPAMPASEAISATDMA